jgi:ribose transport system substrate-binding protein
MRFEALTPILVLPALLGGCGGLGDVARVDGGPPSGDTAPAQSPFAPAAIENVIGSMLTAVTDQNLTASAKPPIAVLLKDLTGFWAPVVTGANRMSASLACASVVQAPLILDPANYPIDQAATDQNQYVASYLSGGIYKGMAYAPQADNAETVQYINNFVSQRGPVVTIDSDAQDTNRSYLIATANYQAGLTAGTKIAEALQPGETVAVFGTIITAWVSGMQRAQGAEDGAAAAGLTVAARIPTIFDVTTDSAALTAALTDPAQTIKGLICVYSNASTCAQVVETLGLLGQVQIVGFDMTSDTKNYFDKGYFYAIAVQRQYYMGELGVLVPYTINVLGPAQTAALLQPLLVGADFIDTGIDLITTANYNDYMTFLSTLGINA